jgi:hypothetical protein
MASLGNSSFYELMEKQRNCSDKGYLIAYGFKYCKRFSDFYSIFDEDVSFFKTYLIRLLS